jgi:hypothetical protein
VDSEEENHSIHLLKKARSNKEEPEIFSEEEIIIDPKTGEKKIIRLKKVVLEVIERI